MCFGDNRAKKQFSQSKFMQYAQPAPAKAGAGCSFLRTTNGRPYDMMGIATGATGVHALFMVFVFTFGGSNGIIQYIPSGKERLL
jgi:hypothetical protein